MGSDSSYMIYVVLALVISWPCNYIYGLFSIKNRRKRVQYMKFKNNTQTEIKQEV